MFSIAFHFLGAGVLGSHLGGDVGLAFFHGEGCGSMVGACGGRGVGDGAADKVGGALGEEGVGVDGGEEGEEEGC